MKPRFILTGILLLLLAVAVGTLAYNRLWSDQSTAGRTGAAFLALAMEGDADRLQSMLADDAKITAAKAVAMYGDFETARVSTVTKALPNQSGVEYVVIASGADKGGYTKLTMLLLRPDDGRWVIVSAGQALSY